MPPFALAGLGFAKRHWKPLAGIAIVVLILSLAFCAGGNREKGKQDQRTIKTQAKVGVANEGAAGKRVEDAVRLEQEKQELRDAIKNVSGDDARRRAGCVILRQQNRIDAAIAAGCGPAN